MRNLQSFLIAVFVLSVFSVSAQRRSNGNISIGVDINLPTAEAVVVNNRQVRPQTRRAPISNRNLNRSLGFLEIHEHRFGDAKYGLNIIDIAFDQGRNFEEYITLSLDGGDTLEIIVQNVNGRNGDYHFHRNGNDFNKNRIIGIVLNGEQLPLRDGNVKYKWKNGFTELKMDIKTIYDDHYKAKLYL